MKDIFKSLYRRQQLSLYLQWHEKKIHLDFYFLITCTWTIWIKRRFIGHVISCT